MCHDARVHDLSPSRFRWYDVPAVLFFRKAIRCRLCDGRYYVMRGGQVDQAFRKKPFGGDAPVHLGLMSQLWPYYAFVIALVGSIIQAARLRNGGH
ncbi:hypothetical protein [Planctomicrobium piriforme]|uniref:Uncharacterized protein n=1 Tax=Planctomicrobium piriforme TaxID=1576369 RepID=A0A1I3RE18_9PLAN|nr:hypothetical protein [Planctomicrobium piriforme]SFJ44260.1 hypothetical protein SAMN05421753_12095 [Planctomicrobium piriforme]